MSLLRSLELLGLLEGGDARLAAWAGGAGERWGRRGGEVCTELLVDEANCTAAVHGWEGCDVGS